MLKLKLQWELNIGATWWEELTHWQRPWCWERLKAGGGGDDRGWNCWMASATQWTWVCVNSGSWWWTGRPGVLRSMGLQRVGHDWATELSWTDWCTKVEVGGKCSERKATNCGHCRGISELWPERWLHRWLRWWRICWQWRRPGFSSWAGRITQRKAWQPTPVFLPGEIPWTEEPGRLQPLGSQRAGYDRASNTSTFTFFPKDGYEFMKYQVGQKVCLGVSVPFYEKNRTIIFFFFCQSNIWIGETYSKQS